MATADGMRTIGASGGPFFPHDTKATKEPHTMTREGHEDGLRTLKITNVVKSYFVTFVTFVISDYYSAGTAGSEAIG